MPTIQEVIKKIQNDIASLNRRIGSGGGGGGETNTASNIGAGGIGVYSQKVGVDLRFRNIIAGSGLVDVALDAPNHEIEIDINPDQIDLNDLADVDAAAPNDGDVLTFDGGAGDWVPEASGGGGGGGAENLNAHRKSGRWYCQEPGIDTWTGYGVTTNYIHAMPFIVPVTQSFQKIGVASTAAVTNGVGYLGLYKDNGDVYPGDLIFGSAELDFSLAVSHEAALGISALDPGLYWLAITCSGDWGVTVQAVRYRYHAFPIFGHLNTQDTYTEFWLRGSRAYAAMSDPFPAGIAEFLGNMPAVCLQVT